MHNLLFSNEIRKQLIEEISITTDALQIITAYCKLNAVQFLEGCIKNNIPNKRLMVRFTFDDIISGSSDLLVYEFCKQHGWDLYIRFDLHAKTYIFDKKRAIIGSANLTSRGIGISNTSNYEIAALSDLNENEMEKIDSLFHNAILMTDKIYKIMQETIEQSKKLGNGVHNTWGNEILSLFIPDLSVLFTYDFPCCKSPNNYSQNDLDFLGLPNGINLDVIKKTFIWSKAFQWLCQTLKQQPTQELYFGTLTATLHNVLLNDPRPFRKEVKELLQNLLGWVQELKISNIIIDQPNHSQRIRYIDQKL